jgi:hypothetical protein
MKAIVRTIDEKTEELAEPFLEKVQELEKGRGKDLRPRKRRKAVYGPSLSLEEAAAGLAHMRKPGAGTVARTPLRVYKEGMKSIPLEEPFLEKGRGKDLRPRKRRKAVYGPSLSLEEAAAGLAHMRKPGAGTVARTPLRVYKEGMKSIPLEEPFLEKGRGKDLRPRKKRKSKKQRYVETYRGIASKSPYSEQFGLKEYQVDRSISKLLKKKKIEKPFKPRPGTYGVGTPLGRYGKSLPFEEPFLEKARPHKYIRRLGAKGQYQYVYQEPFQREVSRDPVQAALYRQKNVRHEKWKPENLPIREFLKQFKEGKFDRPDRRTQVKAGWFDWFSSDIRDKTYALVSKLESVVNSPKINQDTMYVWFNEAPTHGKLYQDFRIADKATGDVIYAVTPRNPHGKAAVWGKENNFNNPLVEGTWDDVKEFFGTFKRPSDTSWAAKSFVITEPFLEKARLNKARTMGARDKQKRRTRVLSVPEQHQLRIVIDNLRNPLKGQFLGGPVGNEAKEIYQRLTGRSWIEN